MKNEVTKIFDVEFKPIKPSVSIASRAARFIAESKGTYADQYDCFECQPYSHTSLIRIYTKKTVPAGLSSLWLCNGEIFAALPGTIDDLERLNPALKLDLNDQSIQSYGALVSKSFTEWGDLYLAEPRGQEEQAKTDLGIKEIISIKKNGAGTWSVSSYHVSNEDDRFARADYQILRSGTIEKTSLKVTLLNKKSLRQVVIM